jgi:hypothetical protein
MKAQQRIAGRIVWSFCLLAAIGPLAAQTSQSSPAADSQNQKPTAASGVVVSGDRVRIGSPYDLLKVQGMLLSVTQIIVPSAPVPQDKKPEQLIQLPKTETREQPKPTSQQSSEDRKSGH